MSRNIQGAKLLTVVDEGNEFLRNKGMVSQSEVFEVPFVAKAFAQFRRCVADGVTVSFVIRTEKLRTKNVFTVHGMSRKFVFDDYHIDKAALRLCIFEVVVCGFSDAFVQRYCPYMSSLATPKFENEILSTVLSRAICASDLQEQLGASLWYSNAIDANAVATANSLSLLHPVYFHAGLVASSDIACNKYMTLVDIRFPDDVRDFEVDHTLAAMQCSVTSFVAHLSKVLAIEFEPYNMMEDWFAATTSSSLLPAHLVSRQTVLAMYGDSVLRAALFGSGLRVDISPGALNNHHCAKFCNAYMSTAFADSVLASHVVCDTNVSLNTRNVGSKFLQAIAAVIFVHKGIDVLERFLILFEMQLS